MTLFSDSQHVVIETTCPACKRELRLFYNNTADDQKDYRAQYPHNPEEKLWSA